jgi:hypothetical protein
MRPRLKREIWEDGLNLKDHIIRTTHAIARKPQQISC